MSSPREAQLPLLLSISEGLSRGTDEMLRVSPQGDAIHPPSCSLAIRESVEEIKWLRAEVERLHKAHEAACRGGEWLLAEKVSLRARMCGEISDLRAENARLRAQVAEYFAEPETHPVEREE